MKPYQTKEDKLINFSKLCFMQQKKHCFQISANKTTDTKH